MINILAFPEDVFGLIIKHLVVTVGIRKAVLLRAVNRAFDASILHAICVSQVVDINDPATPTMIDQINDELRARVYEVQARRTDSNSSLHLQIVARVNHALDKLFSDTDIESTRLRHQIVAGGVLHTGTGPIDAHVERQCVLCAAALMGRLSVIKILLESQNPPNVNGATTYFNAPLTLAAAGGHLDIVQYLLENGARLEEVTKDIYVHEEIPDMTTWDSPSAYALVRYHVLREKPPTALRAAVLGGHKDVVHLLLRSNHRLPTSNLEYLRAIAAGAETGQIELIQTLFDVIEKDISDFEDLDKEMMERAIDCNQIEIVKWLMSKGYDVKRIPTGRFDFNTLERAAGTGNTAMIGFFLEQGVDIYHSGPDKSTNGPIEKAAYRGHEQAVNLLLAHGADPVTAIHRAAAGGQSHLLASLLRLFPDLISMEEGEVGRDALSFALGAMNLASITLLVEAGVSLNEGWVSPYSLPVEQVLEEGNQWLVPHLVDLGAAPSTIKDDDSQEMDDDFDTEIRGVIVTERTWEWVGKY